MTSHHIRNKTTEKGVVVMVKGNTIHRMKIDNNSIISIEDNSVTGAVKIFDREFVSKRDN